MAGRNCPIETVDENGDGNGSCLGATPREMVSPYADRNIRKMLAYSVRIDARQSSEPVVGACKPQRRLHAFVTLLRENRRILRPSSGRGTNDVTVAGAIDKTCTAIGVALA